MNNNRPIYANAFGDWAGGLFSSIGAGFGLAGKIVDARTGAAAANALRDQAFATLDAAKYGYLASQQAGADAITIKQQEGMATERIIKIAAISVGGLVVVGVGGFIAVSYTHLTLPTNREV